MRCWPAACSRGAVGAGRVGRRAGRPRRLVPRALVAERALGDRASAGGERRRRSTSRPVGRAPAVGAAARVGDQLAHGGRDLRGEAAQSSAESTDEDVGAHAGRQRQLGELLGPRCGGLEEPAPVPTLPLTLSSRRISSGRRPASVAAASIAAFIAGSCVELEVALARQPAVGLARRSAAASAACRRRARSRCRAPAAGRGFAPSTV